MIDPPMPPPRMSRQQRLQPNPLLIRQIMTMHRVVHLTTVYTLRLDHPIPEDLQDTPVPYVEQHE